MNRCVPLLSLLMIAGCAGHPVASSQLPYQPGQKGVLAYREELHYGEMTEFGGVEMPFEVKPDSSGTLTIAFGISRFFTGNTYKDKTEMYDSNQPQSASQPTWRAQANAEFDRNAAAMKTLKFSAVLDSAGRMVSFVGTGTPYEKLKGVPASQRDLAELAVAGVYKTIVEESTAYLPVGRSVQAGTSWKVHRPVVLPLHQFGIGMLTGCAAVSEDATCRVESVRATLGGQVATICFGGPRRAVAGYESAGSPTGNWLQTEGRIEFNLDTGELLSHRIVSKTRMADPGNTWTGEFVDALTIKRR